MIFSRRLFPPRSSIRFFLLKNKDHFTMSAPVNPAARPARGPTVQVGPEGGWQKTVQGLVKSVAMFVGLQMGEYPFMRR